MIFVRFVLIMSSAWITPAACAESKTIDESCYYRLHSDTRTYLKEKGTVGPFAYVAERLTDEFFDGERIVLPVTYKGTMVFADRCDLIETDNHIAAEFSGSEFEYELEQIEQTDYYRIAEELFSE